MSFASHTPLLSQYLSFDPLLWPPSRIWTIIRWEPRWMRHRRRWGGGRATVGWNFTEDCVNRRLPQLQRSGHTVIAANLAGSGQYFFGFLRWGRRAISYRWVLGSWWVLRLVLIKKRSWWSLVGFLALERFLVSFCRLPGFVKDSWTGLHLNTSVL